MIYPRELFGDEFFSKHQKILLMVANSPLLRWTLGLNRLPEPIRPLLKRGVAKIAPSGLHFQNEDGSFTATCFTRPRFSEALAFSLSPFAHLAPQMNKRHLVLSPVGLLAVLVAICKPQLSLLAIGATDTIYTGSGDGYVDNSGVWATIRAATSGNAHDSTSGGFDIACTATYISRLFFPTDTSSLPASPTISAASLFIYGGDGTGTNANSTSAEVVQTSQASTSSLTANDFDNLTFASGGSKTFASWNGSGYNEIALDATGRSWISDSGYSMLGVITGRDLSNTIPTGSNWVSNRFSEASGSSNDPYLSITYTVPSVDTTGFFHV